MRTVTLLLAVAVVLAGTACGDDDGETTSPPAATDQPAGPTGANGEAEEPGGQGDGSDRGGDGAPSDRERVELVLRAFFTSGDASLACGEVVTEALLRSAYGDAQGCRQAQVAGAIPRRITIERASVSGEGATATVIPRGGPNDGIETEVTLVREGADWRIDSLEADIPAGP
jgi:hypothetical protein